MMLGGRHAITALRRAKAASVKDSLPVGLHPAPNQPKKRNKQPEQEFQIAVVETVLERLEALGRLAYAAFSNGFKRSPREAGIAKAMGQRAGAWDLIIFRTDGSGTGFGLELKWGKGETSDNQDEFAERMARIGWRTHVCRTMAEVMTALEQEGIL
ncbi:MAG: hypothetical protein JWO51_183 [Rhodospirillales bacterium]|nr:hypothetical protein [Rhodospirillales bacterium]